MKIIQQLKKTITGLNADRIKAAQKHDWAEFDRLTQLVESTRRYKESWEAKTRGRAV